MFKKSCHVLESELLYEDGQHFLDTQNVTLNVNPNFLQVLNVQEFLIPYTRYYMKWLKKS